MNDTELPGYSSVATEHYRHPRNVGRIEGANGVGEVDDRATENLISIYLRVDNGSVTDVGFRTFGCSACIAASSVATELVKGKSIMEAREIDAAAVLGALQGLPPGKHHCAHLAAQALGAAIDNYIKAANAVPRS